MDSRFRILTFLGDLGSGFGFWCCAGGRQVQLESFKGFLHGIYQWYHRVPGLGRLRDLA